MSGYIGVDLDGTLAQYGQEPWDGISIGPPVPAMLERVRRWLDEGKEIRIVTARASLAGKSIEDVSRNVAAIAEWLYTHLGPRGYMIPVVCEKTFELIELWDDRAVQVERNTGRRVDGKE